MDWEILEVDAITTNALFKLNHNIKNTKKEKYRRVRTIINGRLGSDISALGCMKIDDQINRAILSSARGPKVCFSFGQGRKGEFGTKTKNINIDSNVNIPIKPYKLMEIEEKTISYSLKTKSGLNINQKITDIKATIGLREDIPIIRIDLSDHINLNEVAYLVCLCQGVVSFDNPWVFTPSAISSLALGEVLNHIVGKSNYKEKWNESLIIMDRAVDPGFDMEGIPKEPTIFIQDGILQTKAHNLLSSEIDSGILTGHGGLNGKIINDLYVGPKYISNIKKGKLIDFNFNLIVGGYTFPSNSNKSRVMNLSFLKPIGKNKYSLERKVVKCNSIINFINSASWIGAAQFGIHPWVSPWLKIYEPQKCFELLI